jgi:hypothetical protein
MLTYVVGLLCLFPVVVAQVHQLPRRSAVGVGLVGAFVYQGVYFIFIR